MAKIKLNNDFQKKWKRWPNFVKLCSKRFDKNRTVLLWEKTTLSIRKVMKYSLIRIWKTVSIPITVLLKYL